VLTSFAGSQLHSYCDLIIATDSRRPGETVAVGLTRGSRALTVQLTLGQEPAQSQG
jgi:S1-C subfamily serine protease